MKLAHDDPRAAARLLLGLVPAQTALLQAPLEYDLTIRELGTLRDLHRRRAGVRRRDRAAAHALGGRVPRRGRRADAGRARWPESPSGSAAGAGLSGSTAAGAAPRRCATCSRAPTSASRRRPGPGAALEPDLVFRLFAYAIQPAWTKGHAFTVAQEVPTRAAALARRGRRRRARRASGGRAGTAGGRGSWS